MRFKRLLAGIMVITMISGSCIFAQPLQTEAASKKLTKITMKPKKATINVGETKKLQVVKTPKAAKATIKWKSSNKKVAKVTSKGVVKGVKPGKAKITAKVKGRKLSAKCTVTVKAVPVKSISCSNASMKPGQTLTLKPTISPSNATNKKLQYTSSNTKVVTVDKTTGSVTAVAAGTATITIAATDGSKKTAKVNITVDSILATDITPNQPVVSLDIGAAFQVTVTWAPGNTTNKNLTYTSFDPEIATISSAGIITAVKEGRAEIQVKTADGSAKTAKIVVNVSPVLATNIAAGQTAVGLDEGTASQLQITFTPANTTNQDLAYVSSDPDVATVSDTGLITAVKEGTAMITAKTTDGSKKSVNVNVTVNPVPATSMNAEIPKTKLLMGEKMQVQPNIAPSNASVKSLKYTFVNPLLGDDEALTAEPYDGYLSANVSDQGIIEGIAKGPALLRVETTDGSGFKKLLRFEVEWEDWMDKPRCVATTDGEVDDQASMNRLLTYANEIDIEAIVLNSSQWHRAGMAADDPDNPSYGTANPTPINSYRWGGTEWIYEDFDNYEIAYENMRVHDPDYPTPDYLRSIYKIGEIRIMGGMMKDTEGTLFVKDLLLDDDPRPIQLQAWGGPNTVSRALVSIQEDYMGKGSWTNLNATTGGVQSSSQYTPGTKIADEEDPERKAQLQAEWDTLKTRVSAKTFVYLIGDQDGTYASYISRQWPDLTAHYDGTYGAFAYSWQSSSSYADNYLMRAKYMIEHATKGHGPYMANYRSCGDGHLLEGEQWFGQDGKPEKAPAATYDEEGYQTNEGSKCQFDFNAEGDSPAFFALLDRGLRSSGLYDDEKIEWGNWAGRFSRANTSNIRYNSSDVRDYNPNPTNRLGTTARGWAANYALSRWFEPIQREFFMHADWFSIPNYEGANHMPSISIKEGLDLKAAPGEQVRLNAIVSDPDGDRVDVKWWHYGEADTYKEKSKEGLAADGTTSSSRNVPEMIHVQPSGASGLSSYFHIPSDAEPGDTIHIIAEAVDNGEERGKDHDLRYYQRIIITVEGEHHSPFDIITPASVDNAWDADTFTYYATGTGAPLTTASRTFKARLVGETSDLPTSGNQSSVTLQDPYRYVAFFSSDPSVATITEAGVITPRAPGTTKITAQVNIQSHVYYLNTQVYKHIYVHVAPPSVSSIALAVPGGVNPEEIPLGENVTLTTTVLPSNAIKTVTWSSSDTSVATVNSSGRVTPVAAGSVTITATATDGSNAVGKIDLKIVGKKAASLNAEIPKTELVMGETVQINASVTPSDASDKILKYTSSDPYAATVSETGLITALAKGSTTIAVETVDGSELKKEIDLTIDYDLENDPKVRTIVTSDGEADDKNSLRRLMLYANEFDLEGFVLSSSQYHWAGDPEKGIEAQGWHGIEKCVNDLIEQYEKIYKNLSSHDPDFPTPNYYKDICVDGNIKWLSEMDGPTEGSDLIKEAILDDDPRQLYLQAWGGPNTIAMALKSIEDDYKSNNHPNLSDAEWDAAKATDSEWIAYRDGLSEKITMYLILEQDTTYKDYIAPTWPNIEMIIDGGNFWRFAYQWKSNTAQDSAKLGADWHIDNIKFGHGPLLDEYFLMGDGTYLDDYPDIYQRGLEQYLIDNPQYAKYDFVSEGDSPAFFYLLDRGLGSLADPSYGGWGGRFGAGTQAADANRKVYRNNVRDYNPNKNSNTGETQYALTRWINDIQGDFAARADWCVTPNFEDVNHMPNLTIKEGLDITATPGEVLMLQAVATDPDGDRVDVQWWNYCEAGTYEYKTQNVGGITQPIPVNMVGAESKTVKVTIPEDAKNGDTIHIIAQATDHGEHNLKYYQRVIITVDGRQEIEGMTIKASNAVVDANYVVNRSMSNANRTLTVEFSPEGITGKTVTWSSSDDTIATVSSNRITIPTTSPGGPVTITATANDGSGMTATINLTIVP